MRMKMRRTKRTKRQATKTWKKMTTTRKTIWKRLIRLRSRVDAHEASKSTIHLLRLSPRPDLDRRTSRRTRTMSRSDNGNCFFSLKYEILLALVFFGLVIDTAPVTRPRLSSMSCP